MGSLTSQKAFVRLPIRVVTYSGSLREDTVGDSKCRYNRGHIFLQNMVSTEQITLSYNQDGRSVILPY
jgi:hypothetical protein